MIMLRISAEMKTASWPEATQVTSRTGRIEW